MAPDRGRLSIFLPIVVGLVVWLYRRVGFPVMSFPPVCRFLRAVSGECGVEVSSGDGLVRFASSSTVTRRCFCLRCSFSVGGCFLPGGGAVGAVAAGSISRAGGVYSVSSFGPSLVLGSSGILGRFVSLRGFSSGRRDGCEDDFSFHISDVSAGDGCSRFVYQLFAKSGWFFCPTSLGGLLSPGSDFVRSDGGPGRSCGVGSLSLRQGDGWWPSSEARAFSGVMVCRCNRHTTFGANQKLCSVGMEIGFKLWKVAPIAGDEHDRAVLARTGM